MITVVTAYVPIAGNPRSEQEYRKLGMRLCNTGIPLVVREAKVEDLWLLEYLELEGGGFTHSVADNPAKNSIAYHAVGAQKSQWVLEAANDNPSADVLVWIDYGIFHLGGVTPQIIQEFLTRAAGETAITVPGCWGRDYIYNDAHPCWRFCGGVLVVPRKYAHQFDVGMKCEYMDWLSKHKNVSWEVNTLARLERNWKLPIRWYKADHDETMFTNYRAMEYTDG